MADIKVLDPKDYKKLGGHRPQDIEDIVVHELVHCLLPDIEDSLVEEQAVVRLSRALVNERRNKVDDKKD